MNHAESGSGRAVIVTGASSGLGASIARSLGASGFELYLVGRSVEGLADTARVIAAAGGPVAHCESLDIAQPGALAAYVTRVGEEHPYLFALINNAGIMHPEALIGGRPDRWRAMMDVNYLAPLEACVAAITVMRRHGNAAHLLNISSVAAELEQYGAYSASKKALEMVCKTLRAELSADDIRITTLVPGAFATQLGRDFSPELQAGLAQTALSKGINLAAGPDERVMGNPEYIARAVQYVLSHPPTINIERMVLRPPMDL